jgi:hypothetical protein
MRQKVMPTHSAMAVIIVRSLTLEVSEEGKKSLEEDC